MRLNTDRPKIDENSRKLAESVDGPVHERLYKKKPQKESAPKEQAPKFNK